MISTKGRYAIRLMTDLAQHSEEGFVALKDIAARQDISKKYLEQIIPLLTRENMLVTGKGARGGYRLLRTPEEYTVADILRAAEGSLAPVACLEQPTNLCPRAGRCITLPVWEGLYRLTQKYLGSITLKDIIEGNVETAVLEKHGAEEEYFCKYL